MGVKRLIVWLIGAPLVLAAILLSVANRQVVTFSLDPFSLGEPLLAVDVPLFALLFAAVFFGLLIGWTVGWSGHFARQRARRAAAAGAAKASGGEARALVPRA
jgi:hypothetical protein